MSSNGGYGICGSFNVYSSTAKLGNWVEDTAGHRLASQPRPAVGMYVTNTQAHHIDPAHMVANPKLTQVKMMSTAELKAKNKEGTSYSLLFNHGKTMDADERYRTANQERFKLKDFEERFARPQNSLSLERNKQAIRETRAQFKQMSGSRMAAAYTTLGNEHYTPAAAQGTSQALPKWGRQAILSMLE